MDDLQVMQVERSLSNVQEQPQHPVPYGCVAPDVKKVK